MLSDITTKVGKRGTVVIPATLRRRYGLAEGRLLVTEARDDGILLRPAAVLPIEVYGAERQAECLLSNAVDAGDNARAVATVREMGLDPDTILYVKPTPPRRRSR